MTGRWRAPRRRLTARGHAHISTSHGTESRPEARTAMSEHSHAGHGHAPGHAHDHAPTGDAGRLGLALAITVVFMAVEVVGGLIAGSLALIADAGHMLVDAAALALALLALRASRRPANAQRSYGHQRAQV